MVGLDENFLNNDVVQAYVFWSSVLIIKMLVMSLITGCQRNNKKAFANPEDLPDRKTQLKVDPDVERVRRAHRNDLENILPYFVAGLFYILTNPSPVVAINLFRIAAIARIAHSIVYAVYVLPQPARALSWMVHYAITLYMAVQALLFFL